MFCDLRLVELCEMDSKRHASSWNNERARKMRRPFMSLRQMVTLSWLKPRKFVTGRDIMSEMQ